MVIILYNPMTSINIFVYNVVVITMIQTDGGKVRVKEVKIAINNGKIVTGVLYGYDESGIILSDASGRLKIENR